MPHLIAVLRTERLSRGRRWRAARIVSPSDTGAVSRDSVVCIMTRTVRLNVRHVNPFLSHAAAKLAERRRKYCVTSHHDVSCGVQSADRAKMQLMAQQADDAPAAVKRRREALGISQERLAEIAGISRSTVSRIERGLLLDSLPDVERVLLDVERSRDVVTFDTNARLNHSDNPSHEVGHQLTIFLEWAEIKSQLDPVCGK